MQVLVTLARHCRSREDQTKGHGALKSVFEGLKLAGVPQPLMGNL